MLSKEIDDEAEAAIPKTWRDYLAPVTVLIFPAVAILVWFAGIPWLQSLGLMATYTVVWYLSLTALSVFFTVWAFQYLDEWATGPRNKRVQAKKIELELLRKKEIDGN
ncbi:hypothetical protein [Nitrospira sp. M1]